MNRRTALKAIAALPMVASGKIVPVARPRLTTRELFTKFCMEKITPRLTSGELRRLTEDEVCRMTDVRPSIRTITTESGLRVPLAFVEFVGSVPVRREKGFR